MKIINMIKSMWHLFNKVFIVLTPVADLIIRVYVARVFYLSGLTKIQSWDTTLYLFNNEYAVPLIPPDIAAYMATSTELGISMLVAVGLFGRVPALILFVFNIIAAYSYPFLWTAQGAVGLEHHLYWGLLLLVPLFHGSGKLSLDAMVAWVYHRKYSND